jgi:type I restriction enzyme S subunit
MINEERQDQRVLDWVGGIPERWEVHSLGSQLAANKSSNKGMVESRVLSLSYGRVIVKPLDKLRGLVPESFETYQIVEPGDIVIRPTDLQNDHTSLRVGQSMHRGIITSAYICLRPTDSLNHRYASYLLAAYDFMKVFYGFGSGLRQNLDVKHIKHIPVPVPSLAEQGLIVRYLDQAELRIAKAIAAKQTLMSRLLELRRVQVAVGILGSDGAKLLSSSLPYKVPESWCVEPFWSVAPEVSIANQQGKELLSVYLNRGVIRYSESAGQVHKPSLNLSGYQLVRPGDLVLNNQQAWRGSVGVSRYEGIVSPAYVICSLGGRFDLEYANMLFRSPSMVSQFEVASRGVGSIQRQLHRQTLRVAKVPIPPMDEQVQIATRLLSETKGLDFAIQSLEVELALLKEYRTRLISDVVTGKLDVRKEAAKLPEIDPMELATISVGENGDDEETTDDD